MDLIYPEQKANCSLLLKGCGLGQIVIGGGLEGAPTIEHTQKSSIKNSVALTSILVFRNQPNTTRISIRDE